MPSNVTADFSKIRYAQCWEDADVLLTALDIQPGDTCLSIASAGDNSLAMLTRNPARVIALDLSPVQLACLELRVAAYRELEHDELLVLMGSRPGKNRMALYRRCRPHLAAEARQFWDTHPANIDQGIGHAGKFERYFTLFRRYALPLVHPPATSDRLLKGGILEQREFFYEQEWNTWRWRLMFRLFFSRFFMGRAGRDPSFFKYVNGSVASGILARTRYALTQLDPADNPYLQWILTGRHTTALPYALRPEHFAAIRTNLDRLEWHACSVEDYLDRQKLNPQDAILCETAKPNTPLTIDRFNLSDIFEYLSPTQYHQLLQKLAAAGTPGGRLVYWNMLAPRSRPPELAHQLQPLDDLARSLHAQDKAFFYNALVIEEIL